MYVPFTSHFSPRFLHLITVKQSPIEFLKDPLIFYYFMANGVKNFTPKCFQEFLSHKFPLPGFTDNRGSSIFLFLFFVCFVFVFVACFLNFNKVKIGVGLRSGDRCFKCKAIASILGRGVSY